MPPAKEAVMDRGKWLYKLNRGCESEYARAEAAYRKRFDGCEPGTPTIVKVEATGVVVAYALPGDNEAEAEATPPPQQMTMEEV
jgi:hypothetical protein